ARRGGHRRGDRDRPVGSRAARRRRSPARRRLQLAGNGRAHGGRLPRARRVKRTTILMTSTGEAHLLRRSLPAALAQDDADVVVIDNGCSDDTSPFAEELGARVIRFAETTQYCAVTNAGIAATGGDAVLLLNADCFLEPGYLAAARPRLDE